MVKRFPYAGSAYTSKNLSFRDFLSCTPWIFVAGLTFLTTLLNLHGINVIANMNSLIVFIQIVMTLIFWIIDE